MKSKEEIWDSNFDWWHAMDEYAEQLSTSFIEWAYNEGWQTYDSHETWLNLGKQNTVLTTQNLFKLFKKENNIK